MASKKIAEIWNKNIQKNLWLEFFNDEHLTFNCWGILYWSTFFASGCIQWVFNSIGSFCISLFASLYNLYDFFTLTRLVDESFYLYFWLNMLKSQKLVKKCSFWSCWNGLRWHTARPPGSKQWGPLGWDRTASYCYSCDHVSQRLYTFLEGVNEVD